MRVKSLLAVPICGAAFLGAGVGPADAEGQVERGPDHANSICSFSGLNDDPDAGFPEGGRVQSYGQLVRQGVLEPSALKGGPHSPGTYCNGHLHPWPENPPPPPE
jgi:hypothetical protein